MIGRSTIWGIAVTHIGVALLLWSAPCLAAQPISFREISVPVSIWVDTYPNNEPRVVYNSRHQEFLVLWTTRRNPTTRDIWARHVSRDGRMTDAFLVTSYPGRYCYQPRAVYNPTQDEYMVVFTCWHGLTGYDVFATRLYRETVWQAHDAIAVAATKRAETHPAVAYNVRSDEYLLVWTERSDRFDASLWLRRIVASSGKWLGDAIEVSGLTGEQRAMADVAYNAIQDRYLLAYLFEADGPADVRFRSMPGDLSSLGTEYPLWEHTAALHALPPVVTTGADEYLVVWPVRYLQAPPPSTEYIDLYLQRIDGSGVAIGKPGGTLLMDHLFDEHYDPDVAYSEGYGYLVVSCYASSTRWEADVYGYHVLEEQDTSHSTGFAIDQGTGKQLEPAVACAPNGECLVAEVYQATTRSDGDILGRFIRPGWLAARQR